MNYKKKNTSFTLIELLVVIVIIGVLAGVIIVTTTSSISKANIAKLKVFEEGIANNLSANMISRWKLDGNANDAWGSNNGTPYFDSLTAGYGDSHTSGPMSEANCVSGTCFKFDGVDDYVDCNTNFSSIVNVSKTFSAWVNFSNIISEQRILNMGYNSSLTLLSIGIAKTTANKAYVQYRKGGTWDSKESISLLNNGSWHLIVASQNNTNIYLYIDGALENSDNGLDIVNYVSSPTAKIGRYFDTTSTLFFNGRIDDVRIYDAALSSSQIKQNYIAGLNSLLSKNLISEEEYNQRIENLSQK